MSKKARFRTPFDSQNTNGVQTLSKSAWQHFYHISSSLCKKFRLKMSLLVICEMLGQVVNDNYSLRKSEKLPKQIQMQ